MAQKVNLSSDEYEVLRRAVPCDRQDAHKPSAFEFDPSANALEFMMYAVHITTEGTPNRVVVYMIGMTATNKSICVRYKKFKPYFYLRMPDRAGQEWIDRVLDDLHSAHNDLPKTNLKSVVIERKRP